MREDFSAADANFVGGPVFSTLMSGVDQMVIWYRTWQSPCAIERRATVLTTRGIAEYRARYDPADPIPCCAWMCGLHSGTARARPDRRRCGSVWPAWCGAGADGGSPYRETIGRLEAAATGKQAMAPSDFFGLILGASTPFSYQWARRSPAQSGRFVVPGEIRASRSDSLCGKPLSNAPT